MELQATKEHEIEVLKIGNRPPIFAVVLSLLLREISAIED